MQLLALLLSPFTLIYYALTRFRNHLFDIGYKKSVQFDHMVIAVGNLSVGGTGKTPMVEYLIRLLGKEYKLATLSRGYGRKSKGFRMATETDDASSIGDEPFQFYWKYGSQVKVAVGEERALAIPEIIFNDPDNQIILLDDAYQHRTVTPDFNILLTNYNRPFYHDWVLPSGRLREPRKGAKRADMIVVTKCPTNLDMGEMQEIGTKIRKYAGADMPVFFSAVKYLDPKPAFQQRLPLQFSENIYLLTGIANAKPLAQYIAATYKLLHHKAFKDHHHYTPKDVKEVITHFKQFGERNKIILTTEKDIVKLMSESLKREIQQVPVFYLPIECYFLENGHIFDAELRKAVEINVERD
ncbi:tetraacyldisaccharide 4'-kinase [Fulvivirgaceae bacterium BMA12]|uniref:Tetraacyldisaccharide 4'-kinase n=1 Tax=Agaribacillus aureus TaxID=3051825 RepID=A0ABT8L5P4_9BACT|nr:tetraacyldisaccharide 4'-kinase [Fulvivirgaceae bacterium BMA12]